MDVQKDRTPFEDEIALHDIHEQTKPFRKSPPDMNAIPAVFKKYASKKIPLPRDWEETGMSVENAIVNRFSSRSFEGKMTLSEAGKVLFFSKGFKSLMDTELGIVQKCNVPSAGSRHPIELYGIVRGIEGISDGIYHYDNENHALEVIREGSIDKKELEMALGENNPLMGAPMIIVMTAIHRRSSWKYGPRAYRFIHLDAGHIGQNIYLIGESMGLGVCAFGGWKDGLEKLIRIDGLKELAVYVLAVGKKGQKV